MHSLIQVIYLFTDSYQAKASYCLPRRRSRPGDVPGPPAFFLPYKASFHRLLLCK